VRGSRLASALAAALVLSAGPALAQADEVGGSPRIVFQPTPGNFTFGGSFGFGFGSVNWVSVSPQVGYLFTDRLWSGVTGRLQYTNDTRTSPSFNSFDYGVGVFTRYFVMDRLFAQAEWSWQSYETLDVFGQTGRQSVSSVYLGGGYTQPLSGATAVLVELLYDVTGNAKSIYGTPFALRVGVTTGF